MSPTFAPRRPPARAPSRPAARRARPVAGPGPPGLCWRRSDGAPPCPVIIAISTLVERAAYHERLITPTDREVAAITTPTDRSAPPMPDLVELLSVEAGGADDCVLSHFRHHARLSSTASGVVNSTRPSALRRRPVVTHIYVSDPALDRSPPPPPDRPRRHRSSRPEHATLHAPSPTSSELI